jgi:triacylglycerol lipase
VSDHAYPGRVHLGFAEAATQLWPEIRRLLGDPSRVMPLWVTGHSLGGAMATLASVRLMSEGYDVRAVYTYGSPRVGDRDFRDCYELPNYRFVNHNDLVPHLPFRWCYKHVGHVKLLDHQGELHEDTAVWKSNKRRLRSRAKQVHRAHRDAAGPHIQTSGFDWFSDHQIAGYVDAIQKLLPQLPHTRRVRRHVDHVRSIPLHLLWRGSASSLIAPPHLGQNHRQYLGISQADFVKAFFEQARTATR